MNVIPKSDVEMMQFVITHLEAWSADPAGVGLDAGQLTELANLSEIARASRKAADAARLEALAATAVAHADARMLRDTLAKLVRTIKAFAEAQPAPASVYADALIPAPRTPGATAPPPIPSEVTIELAPRGGVRVNWKAASGSPSTGCVFKVVRSIPWINGGRFEVVGVGMSLRGGKYTFVDDTLPAGVTGASYGVIAMRGRRESAMSFAVTASFGQASVGAQAEAIKLAA